MESWIWERGGAVCTGRIAGKKLVPLLGGCCEPWHSHLQLLKRPFEESWLPFVLESCEICLCFCCPCLQLLFAGPVSNDRYVVDCFLLLQSKGCVSCLLTMCVLQVAATESLGTTLNSEIRCCFGLCKCCACP